MSNRSNKRANTTPYFSEEFLKYMENKYKEIIFDPNTFAEEIQRHFGRREVVKELRRLHELSDK